MKISSVHKSNYDASYNNNLNNHSIGLNKDTPSDSVSFKGIAFKEGATKMFKEIEKNGFFVEFLIVDTLSMILPRILVGLNRDRDKTGKINYKAGAEEAGREILSGPSMNLIPMGILAIVSSLLPASRMEGKALKTLTESMVKITSSGAKLDDKNALSKNLAEELFEKTFNSKDFNYNDAKIYKNDFVNLLEESTSLKPKSWLTKMINKMEGTTNNPYESKRAEFEALVAKINNKTTSSNIAPKNPKSLLDGLSAKDLFDNFRSYSNDVIDKLAQKDYVKNAAENYKKSAKEFLENAQKFRGNIKLATAVTAFMAVGTFLLYLPKLYQQGGLSPAEESAKRARGENTGQGGASESK